MSSSLRDQIQTDLNKARKGRDKLRTLVLSTLLAEIKNKEIESRGELDDETVVQVVSKGIKQRRDASEQMREAGRGELADQEDAQERVLADYLPEALSEDEVRAIVRKIIESGVDQLGPLMGQVIPLTRGRFDGKEANRIVREELGS
ncbi:MAG TPA: aspartyl-tRNA amidotransferase [Gemmatimonadetes bacterium]|nr:aspartyl-tRNA amidotransferase [Gemmatimonadota bacterium]HAT37171.1 aspartyl-tRNA amidotransferase [Gemmatimonadota bacterium]HBV06027.1 aspartyl-tRNA amidotransferase [Gemmatimonadota bacterium]